jgi:ATP-dependent RNA helicase RhlE
VTPENTAVELVDQVVHPVDRERKRELLTHLVRTREIDQALVFTRTKHGANRLAEQLNRDGIAAAAIHGNKSQPQRVRALADFKAGEVLCLVATEVAARGLDIEALPHVVNFELPPEEEEYLRQINRLLRRDLPVRVVAGFEPQTLGAPRAAPRSGRRAATGRRPARVA